MHNQLPRIPLLFVTVLALALAPLMACADSPAALSKEQSTPAKSVKLAPCTPPGLQEEVLCGSYSVLEDRANPEGRTLDLHLVVLPARGAAKQADPIFFLHGGPGAAASAMAPFFVSSALRQERDIVLLDQRGTGGSSPLRCEIGDPGALFRAVLSFEFPGASACREGWEVDPRFYTTSVAMEDLDEVRQALGAETLNLMGGSYGSRAALEYMRRYPNRVRTAVLRGVAGPADVVPVGFSHSSKAALDRLLADCAGDEKCGQAFPNLAKELEEVLARLEAKPVPVTLEIPGLARPVELLLTRDLFAGALHYQLYASQFAAGIPAGIHAAHGGNFQPLLTRAAGFVFVLAGQFYFGMTFAVLCSEDVPHIDPEAVRRETAETPLRGSLAINLKESCEGWPRGKVDPDYKTPVRSDVPTLLISGTVDPVTPQSQAAEVAKHLPNSLHLVVPNIGHANMAPGCTLGLIQKVIESGSLKGLDAACVEKIERPPFLVN